MAIRARLADWRHRLIGDPRFQRFAARFAPTRPLVRKKAQALFDITAGFVYSQTLLACVELDLFAQLAEGARRIDDLAARNAIAEDRLRILLDAAAALDLLSVRGDGTYALGDLGAAVLGTPGLAAMIRHHTLFYRDLQEPLALLREPATPTRLRDFWAYARPNAERSDSAALSPLEVGDYSELMAASQGFIADGVLDAFDLGGFADLADIGRGQGAFLAAALRRHPGLRGIVFDLPAVVERAARSLASQGLAPRVQTIGGDFLTGRLPSAAILSLIRVLYDHQDDNAQRLMAGAYAALPPGGTLLVAEPMAGTKAAEAMGATYFGFYLLAMGGGRPRRFDDLAALAQRAGFQAIRAHRSARPMLVSVMSARKPA